MTSDGDNNRIPEGCEQCPNRKHERDKAAGKVGSYGFGLLLALLLLGYSFERDRTDGWWHPKDPPPYSVWLIIFPTITTCLGIAIDPEPIGRAAKAFFNIKDDV